jgi:hypothetical protein
MAWRLRGGTVPLLLCSCNTTLVTLLAPEICHSYLSILLSFLPFLSSRAGRPGGGLVLRFLQEQGGPGSWPDRA